MTMTFDKSLINPNLKRINTNFCRESYKKD